MLNLIAVMLIMLLILRVQIISFSLETPVPTPCKHFEAVLTTLYRRGEVGLERVNEGQGS